MIVTADLDLSECGAKPDLPENATKVLIHASNDTTGPEALDAALADIRRCRLIREGHVFSTEIQHAMSTHFISHLYHWRLDADGEVVPA